MTNQEYLTKLLSRFNISPEDVELIVLNQDIDGDGVLDISAVKMAVYKEFSLVLPMADISEGGYSIRWNLTAMKMWYSALAKELGQEDALSAQDAANDVTDRSYLF